VPFHQIRPPALPSPASNEQQTYAQLWNPWHCSIYSPIRGGQVKLRLSDRFLSLQIQAANAKFGEQLRVPGVCGDRCGAGRLGIFRESPERAARRHEHPAAIINALILLWWSCDHAYPIGMMSSSPTLCST